MHFRPLSWSSCELPFMWHGFVLVFMGFSNLFSIKLIYFHLFLLPTETSFTEGLWNGFPCCCDRNAFFTFVVLNFLYKSDQSWRRGGGVGGGGGALLWLEDSTSCKQMEIGQTQEFKCAYCSRLKYSHGNRCISCFQSEGEKQFG